MGLKRTEPTIISVFYKSRATPKAKFNRQEAQVWTRGWAQEGRVCVLPRAALQWDSRTSVAAPGRQNSGRDSNYREKAEPELSVELHVHEEGSVGKGWW